MAEVARLAEGLATLLRVDDGRDTPQRSAPGSTGSPGDPGSAARGEAPTRARSVRKRVKKRSYPRFERDGDRLVKLGWSKKEKSEYEQKAPRSAVLAFGRHLANNCGKGEVFVMESMLPVANETGDEFPSYQAYLTLAWLRHIGAVEKKGRDGYVLRDGSLAEGGLGKLWDQLESQRRS